MKLSERIKQMTFFKQLKKPVLALVTVLTVVSSLSVASFFAPKASAATLPDQTDSSLNIDAKAAIAVDAKTGQVLYAKNAEQTLPVASMSKLLTAYMLCSRGGIWRRGKRAGSDGYALFPVKKV